MSRTDIPAALLTHAALGTTTFADAIRIARTDGEIFRYTSHDVDDVITGIDSTYNGTYLADPGFVASALSISVGCDVGNLEIQTLHDNTTFTIADLLGDTWRNASVIIFRYNYKSYSDGAWVTFAGNFGEIEMRGSTVMAEVHDLRRYLNHPVGDNSSKACRYRLGDDRCLKDISSSGSPFTVHFTVSTVVSTQVFRDANRTEDDDFFGEGEVQWLTGNNAGQTAKVKTFSIESAGGVFTLAKPMWLAIQVGDTGIAIAGCRKRREEDCRDKFQNVENFGGEPDRKGTDSLTKRAVADV